MRASRTGEPLLLLASKNRDDSESPLSAGAACRPHGHRFPGQRLEYVGVGGDGSAWFIRDGRRNNPESLSDFSGFGLASAFAPRNDECPGPIEKSAKPTTLDPNN